MQGVKVQGSKGENGLRLAAGDGTVAGAESESRLREYLVLECGWLSDHQHSPLLFIIKGEEMGRGGLVRREWGHYAF